MNGPGALTLLTRYKILLRHLLTYMSDLSEGCLSRDKYATDFGMVHNIQGGNPLTFATEIIIEIKPF